MRNSNADLANVSRETLERLRTLETLVLKWTPRVNLISKDSAKDMWKRHILDSIQIADIPEDPTNWVDLGSGGGFPGLVVAICLADRDKPSAITLVESDQRKCAFLRAAKVELGLDVTVKSMRIEDMPAIAATTLSARALAPLIDLLDFANIHMCKKGTAIFPKGVSWEKEIADASKSWSFEHEVRKSTTNPDAAIVVVRDIQKK